MEQFKEYIERTLVNNDNERTLILRFFDGYLEREKQKKGYDIKSIIIGLVGGLAMAYLVVELIGSA